MGHADRKAEILSSTGVTSLAGKPSIVGRPSGLTGGAGACGYNGVRRRDLDAHSNSGAVLGLGLATRFAAYLFLDLLDSFINGIGSPSCYLCACHSSGSSLIMLLLILKPLCFRDRC